MKKIIWSILRYFKFAGTLQLVLKSGLIDDGWFKSFNRRDSIDKNGQPIAWWTYPCIKFIEPRLSKKFDMFEFGSGNSTLWSSLKVNTITSVEHNELWFQKIKKQAPNNAQLIYAVEEGGNYADSILKLNKKFHIIVVDGIDRNSCIKNAINCLTDDGIIIFDNSDRKKDYELAFQYLEENQFRCIEFYGLGPGIAFNFCSSIYYKANNCLNI